ncbi:glycine betaine ABC transporter substrate-binding protein [Nitrococcus mobilis]|uniref:ABC transproter, fused inner membrane component and substrate-binding domain n=1 Tax=Nitrococcus mobilis Nb-231 TaxID=314278 RepID=A4BVG2_9GAMM|nr:glycine betaine ABC transporter substrate-binding protein [Nitrococcus mobilis]EAR20282.1 ABC transproter, fused inner membrane component and substrate-binding domain [Nitrococcus mobilis Nb-231]
MNRRPAGERVGWLAVLALTGLLLIVGSPAAAPPAHGEAGTITVGSKADREGHLLGEIFAQTLEAAGFRVERQLGLGQTIVTYQALVEGEIDVYPEYTGTLAHAILGVEHSDIDTLDRLVRRQGLRVLPPLGFNNTYALTMRRAKAQRLGIRRIGDLAAHPELIIGVSHEFRKRQDGWPGLRSRYALPQSPLGLEHGIAYQAIREGSIDVTDAYSTDGDIERFDFMLLQDDQGYFPRYLAVPLVAADLPSPAVAALRRLAGLLDERQMRALNAEVSSTERSFSAVAAEFLAEHGIVFGESATQSHRWSRLGTNLIEHLQLTGIALGLACLVGLPLSLAVYRSPRLARIVLYVAGLLQTIPSIALLALMIPLFGIGVLPAVIALFLYSLLPIVRAAITALLTVDPLLVNVASGIGLTKAEQLRHVILPLAMPNLLTGIRTAAIINIGTATLAAFIGAGGLGEPIVTGLALNDYQLVLYGAIPAALLAIATELLFELGERALIPAHLRESRKL